MRKTRQKHRKRTGIHAFGRFVVMTAFVGAGYWAWQQEHTPNTASAAYREPGWMPEHKSNRWKCIVIHHSACEHGSAETFDEAHRKRGWDGLGYDFVIGNGSETGDGAVEIGYRWARQLTGAHCKTDNQYYNEHGIGICMVGNFDNHPPDEKQLQSLARLVTFLTSEFHIPASEIFTHGGITGKTACPGRDFDLAEFKSVLLAR